MWHFTHHYFTASLTTLGLIVLTHCWNIVMIVLYRGQFDETNHVRGSPLLPPFQSPSSSSIAPCAVNTAASSNQSVSFGLDYMSEGLEWLLRKMHRPSPSCGQSTKESKAVSEPKQAAVVLEHSYIWSPKVYNIKWPWNKYSNIKKTINCGIG